MIGDRPVVQSQVSGPAESQGSVAIMSSVYVTLDGRAVYEIRFEGGSGFIRWVRVDGVNRPLARWTPFDASAWA